MASNPDEKAQYAVLARRLRAGDPAAFNALYLALYPRAMRVARRFVPSSVPAEDVVQEVFLRVWDQRDTLAEHANIEQYVLTAIQNRAYDLLRHDRHVQRSEATPYTSYDTPPAMSGPVAAADVQLERDDLVQSLQRAIDALPDLQRRIVTRRWHGQMSYDAIATELGVTVKVVRLNLERVYNTLRPLLAHLTE
jgi:RNA polymerase sigma-70 factor (ECF subfamily)